MATPDTGSLDTRLAETEAPTASQRQLVRILIVSMIARLVHDASVRVVYPFLPELSVGLRAPVDQVGAVLSLRSGVGVLSPLFGILSDRIGHRRTMSASLVLLAIGLGAVGLSDVLLMAAIGFVVTGIATATYVPALLAYLSERTPYERRGRILGTLELTWALAGMIVVPALGALIGPLGWRAPFLALAIGAMVCAALTLSLPETPARLRAQAVTFRIASIFRNRSATAFLLVWLLMFLSFENVQVGYASWFETQFGLSAQQRGMTQTLFGVFEIAASAGSGLFLDRIGKKRGVTGGLIILLIGYGMLLMFGPLALWLGLAAMSVAFLGFEFSVVSSLSIGSEQIPQARGAMLSLGVMMSGLGRMVGAVSGSALIADAGFGAAALLSALLGAAAAGLFALFVQERPATAP
ncbi:MAG TPA: MFS transporter [Anaerolineae bacterium]|nr:MFS transporter [Anaerolineae bacterium]